MTKMSPPRRIGRPPKGAAALLAPVMLRFPRQMLAEIDAIVAARPDNPDRSSIIRELIAEALERRRRRRPAADVTNSRK